MYLLKLKAGDGVFARCGELYGYDVHSVEVLGASDKPDDSVMYRRNQLTNHWRAVLLSMREGDEARTWIDADGSGHFREYRVHLARVDRLDANGVAVPEEHELLCGGGKR